MSELVERLREDWEMLKDGYQENLTKTWHNHAMTNAAGDCAEAANALEAQEARIAELEATLSGAADRLENEGMMASYERLIISASLSKAHPINSQQTEG